MKISKSDSGRSCTLSKHYISIKCSTRARRNQVLSRYRQHATIIRRFQMHIISIPHQFIRYVNHGVIMRAVTMMRIICL